MGIREWLRSLGLEQHAATFEQEAITPELVRELSDEDLRLLGVTQLGHRVELRRAARSPLADAAPPLVASLPTVLALPLWEAHEEPNPTLRLWAFCDFVELSLRLSFMAAIAEHGREVPAALRARLAGIIERPTLGQWRVMALAAAEHLPSQAMLPELAPTIARLEAVIGGQELRPDEGLLSLRNRLAHGGGVPRRAAAELVRHWQERFQEVVRVHEWWASAELFGRDDQHVWRLRGLERGVADGLLALERGQLALRRAQATRILWPLAHFADGGEHQTVPHVYARRGEVRLEYTPVGGSAAYSVLGDDALAAFLRLFHTDPPPARFLVPGFETETRAEASRRVGRDNELATLVTAAQRVDRGEHTHLWIDGVAGMGKSNLLASLARCYLDDSPSQTLPLVYRFRAGDDRLSRQVFLRFAIERLRAWTGVEPSLRAEQAEERLEQQFETLLGGLLPGFRVLFILDGMDEIAERDPSFITDIVLHSRPDAMTGWICAGRPERALSLAFASALRPFPDGLPPLSSDDVRAIILNRLDRGWARRRLIERDVEREGIVSNHFIERVVEQSEGLPIYVNHVLGELRTGQLTPDQEALLPKGLHAFHERLLARCSIGAVQQAQTPMAALMALARTPLSPAELCDLLARARFIPDATSSLAIVEATLATLAPMLRRVTRPEGEEAFTLFHHSLRQHMETSPSMAPVLTVVREHLRELCRAPGTERPSSRYLHRHGVTHLLEDGHKEDAENLLTSLQALRERFESLGTAGAVATLSEDWWNVVRRGPLSRRAASWESLWQTSAPLVENGTPDWPGDRILATLARDRASHDPAGEEGTAYFASARHPWLEDLTPVPEQPAPHASTGLLLGHRGAVNVADISADGSRVVSGSGPPGAPWNARVWATGTNSCLHSWINSLSPFTAIRFTPGEKQALLGTADGKLYQWDFSSGTVQDLGRIHEGAVHGVVFCGADRFVTSGEDGRLVCRAWPGKEVLWEHPFGDALSGPTFAAGRLVVGSGDGTVHLRSPQDGSARGSAALHSARVCAVALSADGSVLASCAADGSVRVHRARDNQVLQSWTHPREAVGTVDISPDGQLVAFASSRLGASGWVADPWLHILETGTGVVRRFPGHWDEIRQLRFSGDGRSLASASRDFSVRLWSTEELARGGVLEADELLSIETFAASPEGTIAAACWDGTVRIESPSGEHRVLRDQDGPTFSVCWLGDGRLVSGGLDRKVRVWSRAGTLEHCWEVPGSVDRLTALPGTHLVAVSAGASDEARTDAIFLLDVEHGSVVQRYPTRPRTQNVVEPLAIIRQGQGLLAALDERVLAEWDLGTGQLLREAEEAAGAITCVEALHSRGLWIVGDTSGDVRFLDAGTGRVLRRLEGHRDYVRTIAVSPSGRRVATGCDDGGVRLYEVETGRLLAAWFHDTWIFSVAFRDERRIAVAPTAGAWRWLELHEPASG